MNTAFITTEATRSLAMVFTGLGAGSLFASSIGSFAAGDRFTGFFRVGLGFGLLALIFMVRATMPAV